MRVISGIYGGRTLRSPSGTRTRPTSDRLRETLFNVLAPLITEETRFLDLCAGTGAIGIEAISRGAVSVTFVDKSRRACGLIEENLDQLGIPESRTEVVCAAAGKFLRKNPELEWDIIFFDPPYSSDYAAVLALFGEGQANYLTPEGLLVVEHHAKTVIPDAVSEIRRWRLLKQGETRLSFFERN
ncbi:MAG: 16S rRNA (guanine(966)-N(2))-methyltransferase RsmD [Acidobacteria bacterium]|nr:MAG: 16S rRNA (guanine(966)-N(2))-methyltransferase RsmD [Acidobacteriota bacterium]REK01223.1 MAG: 16S rRNA (guanine(966)-N(2))-methyltransferase RsmD [Acidobacteriota bacterium]REK14179.1 MAG: 16S rRNA (guanine(966)-N(2))-methyltransferase RsmD [Acidobacteriota bacterium]REK44894.1 MAG: 16S rRNA (guanine(966)-N(2))-methyltransferase RsmD [Acidobacteriota bacterium]